jgi:hypothetical protein
MGFRLIILLIIVTTSIKSLAQSPQDHANKGETTAGNQQLGASLASSGLALY